MQGIALILFFFLVCEGSSPQCNSYTCASVCRSTHCVSVCVCVSALPLHLPLALSLSLSSFSLSSCAVLQHSASGLCLAELTANRRRGEKKKGNKSEEEEDTPAEGRERQQAARTFCQKGGREQGAKKIENQEKRTLQGAERSGVWRRGDKGRGLIRNRDKYGAMHHSGNTGRTKTLSHETGKTPRMLLCHHSSQMALCFILLSRQQCMEQWSVTVT